MFQWLKNLLRRSIENPSTPLDPYIESNAFNGGPVTQDLALTSDGVWRAVNLISNDVARIPLLVYERKGEGKERATAHPAYKLLRYKPNPFMTAGVFRQVMQGHVLLNGNAYAAITRLGNGEPAELIPLDPTVTFPVRENNDLWYVTKAGHEDVKIPAQDMLHIKGLGFDGLIGYSPVDYAADALGLSLSLRRYGHVFFENNARPNVVLTHPGVLKEEAKKNLRESWERMHKGLDSAHRIAILQEGMTLTAFGNSAEDAQLIEERKFSVREIANFFGIGAWLLGDDTRTSYASLEIEKLAYLDQLDPWLNRWEEECRDKLLTEQEKDEDSHIVEFLRQALLRVDTKTRYEAYSIGISAGFLLPDEVRAFENMMPLPEEPEPEPLDNQDQGDQGEDQNQEDDGTQSEPDTDTAE